jgi:hypothetical protein
VNWTAIAIIGIGTGFFYWLGLRDARARVTGRAAGARATGILLLVGIGLSVFAGWYGLAALALAAVYLLGWFRMRDKNRSSSLGLG